MSENVDWSELEYLGLRVQAIERWPGQATPESARLASPFKGTVQERTDDGNTRSRTRATPFHTTVRDLTRELTAINARHAELGLALRPQDIRRDGFPRANARALHPGVVLAFNLPGLNNQRVTYSVDRFTGWQDNLRAIALGLEALRKVQRYGMGTGWEQYAGYRALPEVASQSPDEARQLLARTAGWELMRDHTAAQDKTLFRQAAKRAQHDEGLMNAVMNAGRTLGAVT